METQGFSFLQTLSDFDVLTGDYVAGDALAGPWSLTESVGDDGTLHAPSAQGQPDGEEAFVDFSGDTLQLRYTGYVIDGAPVFEVTTALGSLTEGSFLILANAPVGVGDPGEAVYSGQFILCFARGTRIATPSGEVAVEELRIGDAVLTADGRAVAVRWIGRQTRHPRFGDAPVRIAAGALGERVPVRALCISPGHALLVDGVLVNAGALVNGRTIGQVRAWQGNLEYFHVETEAHEIILADGAPAETFIDDAGRRAFDNYAEFAALYPRAPEMEELPIGRVQSPRQLPAAIRARLDARADALMGVADRAA